jgi:hypothetical protein
MDRDVRSVIQQGSLDLDGEDPLAPERFERDVELTVASRLDQHEFALTPPSEE